jgi:hypothetical protein
MRRPLALLSLACVALGSLAPFGLVACGADKPPLTPDSVDVPTEGPDSGAPVAPVAPGAHVAPATPSVKK